MDRISFYRFFLFSYYFLYGVMLVLGYLLPTDFIATWEGPRDKINTILSFVIVNILLSLFILIGEYKYRKSIEKDERILTVFLGSHFLAFEVLREDYLPAIYLFVFTASSVTFFVYLHFCLATILKWDITYMRTPGKPIKPDAIISFGPLIGLTIFMLYKFYKWNQKAIKFKKRTMGA